jgi:hypothetical protein
MNGLLPVCGRLWPESDTSSFGSPRWLRSLGELTANPKESRFQETGFTLLRHA